MQLETAAGGKAGEKGSTGGRASHHNVKLLECLLDGGERRNGGAASGRSTAMVAATGKLRALRVFSGGRRLRLGREARAQGALIRVAASLGVRARDAARVGWCRTVVGLGLKSEPVARKGTVPICGTHPSGRERGREEEAGRVGDARPGEGAGPRAGWGGEEGKEKTGRAEELGCTVKKEKKKGSGRLGWAAMGKKDRKNKKGKWAPSSA
jgi:hypothetical protein